MRPGLHGGATPGRALIEAFLSLADTPRHAALRPWPLIIRERRAAAGSLI